jgi:spoIIIJ-associated protein
VVAVIGDDDSGRLSSGEGADVDESLAPKGGTPVTGVSDEPNGITVPPQAPEPHGVTGAGAIHAEGSPAADDAEDAADAGDIADAGFADGALGLGDDADFDRDAGPDREADFGGDADLGADADLGDDADLEGDAGAEGNGEVGPDGDGAARPSPADLEQESEIAADYIEGLLDVADLDGDIDMDVEGDRPLVSVVGATLTELVGTRGEVLEALQELTRLAVHRQTGARSRIMLDVGGYRARRREELTELGTSAAQEVSRSGAPRRLQAMTPFERKIVHDAVAAAGLRSESEGEEPDRRVVVFPAG